MKNYEIIEVTVGDVQMTVTRFGSGKKNMILIPGISLKPVSQSAAAVSYQYKKAWEDYTVYVFDRKKNIEKGYTVREMAKDTAEVMKKLKIDNAYALGVSQGGMILQYLMIDYPCLIKKAVIGSSSARPDEASIGVISNWSRLAENHDVVALNHDCFINIYSEEFLEKYKSGLPLLEQQGSADECDTFAVLCDSSTEFDAYGELDKVKCPVLIIGSKKDKVLSVRNSEELAEKLDCEKYIYDGYSHAVYDEAPDYLDRVLEFFERGD